ncbi:MAG: hypothetical protein A2X49_13345 [Lentisphaerae bacterium GWF2_52_8]|nr:MAG: hypothetical protein A2X49_13345 [Lentisphaerae bacterium GWF2_52_8]
MKKLIMLAVATIAIGLIAGCTSSPKHYNMTGSWKYTFEESGKSEVQNGSMTIAQESYKLRGKCNDSFGEFDISGTIAETNPTFLIEGKRNDGKRSFRLNGLLSSDDKFEGTYTTDQNTSGTMKGKKTTAD